ncbi:CPBP family intramembrane glutamic endopeptidase [Falsirhodobacter sp. 20TX0035]|uniref:CPBP family intramembrane glutamic endopeptidase n=1 Tax=Falsirhodobacter sp. 20TX0035 TaxID=3022019 RepID=UPI00232D937D|nr:CPBP family intramembrane glutamic endopeptidase [Falsirhodobacter sp. 20TX0035]MDB6454423.1 CPBP family intramembrane metalloprotease [Falsirhodobacter sp. 20TX0035]
MPALPKTGARGRRLRIEFVLFYVVTPVVTACLLPPEGLLAGLFLFMLVGLGLLSATPGFRWRELTRGWRAIRWLAVAGLAALTFVSSLAVMQVMAPQSMFSLLDHPERLLLIAVLYPLLSALPQEVVFRALYFRRYRGLVPKGHRGVVLNAALFALAHLMYWSGIVVAMTFVGGLAFAWAHAVRRSFPMAWVMHSVAGVIVFIAGLGIYFYAGNVVRPF